MPTAGVRIPVRRFMRNRFFSPKSQAKPSQASHLTPLPAEYPAYNAAYFDGIDTALPTKLSISMSQPELEKEKIVEYLVTYFARVSKSPGIPTDLHAIFFLYAKRESPEPAKSRPFHTNPKKPPSLPPSHTKAWIKYY